VWLHLADLAFIKQLIKTRLCFFPRPGMNRLQRFHRRLTQLTTLASGKFFRSPQVGFAITE
jgi:hypothetical protein